MQTKNKHSAFTDLIVKYLSGELSGSETKAFLKKIEQDPEKGKLLDEYRKVWDSVEEVSEESQFDLDAEWKILEKKLPERELKDGEEEIDKRQKNIGFYVYRIAAVMLIGLLISAGIFYANRTVSTTLITAESGTEQIELPDGSLVTLNSGSKLRFDKKDKDSERRVFLSGEAFFEVERDTSRPFIIEAGETMVQVLGTSFNVNAYKQNETVEITVNTGLVAFSSKVNETELVILKAGNTGTYNRKNRELKLQPVANRNAISWKTKVIWFEDTPLQEAISVINKVYNANLLIVEPGLRACPITVTFREQSLEAIMNVLESTLDLEFTEKGNKTEVTGLGCE